MSILITGASGFIGSHLLRYLSDNELKNSVILLSSREIKDYKCILHNHYSFLKKDFLDNGVNYIDTVILLGAYVEKTRNEPQQVVKHISSINNILYLLNNLPNIPKKIIYCSSIAVYGFDSTIEYQQVDSSYNEESPINPIRTYALSKMICERLVEEWAKEHKCNYQILRIGSTYGFGTFYNFLGTVLRCAIKGEVLNMYAPPYQKWNFVNAFDVSRWIVNSINLTENPGVINLTSSSNYSSLEILETMHKVFPDFKYIISNDVRYTGKDKSFDSKKREQYLGEEKYSLFDGLQMIKAKSAF